jgi:hypothetical protein
LSARVIPCLRLLFPAKPARRLPFTEAAARKWRVTSDVQNARFK